MKIYVFIFIFIWINFLVKKTRVSLQKLNNCNSVFVTACQTLFTPPALRLGSIWHQLGFPVSGLPPPGKAYQHTFFTGLCVLFKEELCFQFIPIFSLKSRLCINVFLSLSITLTRLSYWKVISIVNSVRFATIYTHRNSKSTRSPSSWHNHPIRKLE